MLRLILRRLRHEAVRTVLTVITLTCIIAEILVLEGFLAGLYDQLRNAVLRRGGDLIVAQAGISNFIAARSILPQMARLQVEEVEGVRVAHPLTGLSVIYERDGRRNPILVLVYDTAGGPSEILEGSGSRGERGIVIDRALAVKYGLKPGDTMEISDFEFTVSGVSTNSAAFLTPFAFITFDDLIDFYFESEVAADIATFPLLSFLLVDLEPGADPVAVSERIEARIDVADVFFPRELALRDERLGREMLGPILGLLLAVSYGIGVLVIAMFMFAAVRGRTRELGVLKALGFKPRTLGTAIVAEAVGLTLIALPAGLALAVVIAQIVHAFAPIYLVLAAEPSAVVRTGLASLAFAAAGALLSMRAVIRIDPAIVFRR